MKTWMSKRNLEIYSQPRTFYVEDKEIQVHIFTNEELNDLLSEMVEIAQEKFQNEFNRSRRECLTEFKRRHG